jgi:hypothetical protein
MFIYSIWDDICRDISNNYNTITIDKILEQSNKTKWIVIKHDVETNVPKALSLAKIEAKYNIKATYFVQADLVEKNYKILQEIQNLGHEVTYHYDVLDANDGDYQKASKEFEKNIVLFQKYGFEVKTVCPHGNPVMIRDDWNSNKDFFRDKNIKEKFSNILDMVVDLPNKIDYNYTYISDAGYGFKEIVNISDNDIQNGGDIDIKNHKELLKLISTKDNVIISTHPHRWESSAFKFIYRTYIFKVLRIIARTVSKIPILKNIISRYYYLAKKI